MTDEQQTKADEIQSDEDIQISEMFQYFDKDNSKTISKEELGNVMRALGQNPTELDLTEMIQSIDINENGMIEFEEFKKMFNKNKKTKEENKEELLEAFRQFDKDGNGNISKEELTKVMEDTGANKEDIESMFSTADVDKDGIISYKEFVDVWSS